MIRARALSLVLPLMAAAAPRHAAALEADAGFRMAIFDENYKRGMGLELGLVHTLRSAFDLGLHLEYTRYTPKTTEAEFPDIAEMGGHVTAYWRPALQDQPFEIRLGPHVGGKRLHEDWYADLGGDAQVLFRVTDRLRAYGAFIPSFLLGNKLESIYRVGAGITFALGASAAAPGPARGTQAAGGAPHAVDEPAFPPPSDEPPATEDPEDEGKPLPGYEQMP